MDLLDFGLQPVCNRFLSASSDEEYTHPIVMGQCNVCGVVQLMDAVPAHELLPRYDWITYNEPEGHLDEMAETMCRVLHLTEESRICGLSYKDDTTLERLRKRGVKHTWRIDPASDLGIADPRAGIETVQDRLSPDVANPLVQKYGVSDVVIARHILEHAHDPLRFMDTLRQLGRVGGYVVFEVPDCTRALETCDYTTVWEEHILYFTPETFRHGFAFSGFSPVRFECYPYSHENSLVGILQSRREARAPALSEDALEGERHRADAFSQAVPKQRRRLNEFVSDYRQRRGKIAMFGAGHLACTFINVMGLKGYLECVVDDDPNKQGLFMPGSRLPIHSSAALTRENITLCLMSLRADCEDRVIRNNLAWLERGGAFASIFPGSQHVLRV